MGYLVEVVFPEEALVDEGVGEGLVVHEELEELEHELLVFVNEVAAFGGGAFGGVAGDIVDVVLGLAEVGEGFAEEVFIVVPVDAVAFYLAAEVVVVGYLAEEDVVDEAQGGVLFFLGGAIFLTAFLNHYLCYFAQVYEGGYLYDAKVVETMDVVGEVLFGGHHVADFGVFAGVKRLEHGGS